MALEADAKWEAFRLVKEDDSAELRRILGQEGVDAWSKWRNFSGKTLYQLAEIESKREAVETECLKLMRDILKRGGFESVQVVAPNVHTKVVEVPQVVEQQVVVEVPEVHHQKILNHVPRVTVTEVPEVVEVPVVHVQEVVNVSVEKQEVLKEVPRTTIREVIKTVKKPVTKVEEILVEVPVGLHQEIFEYGGHVISRREYLASSEEESLHMRERSLGATTVPWNLEHQDPWTQEALSELHELRQSNAFLTRQNSWVAQDIRECARRVEMLRADIDRERRDARSMDEQQQQQWIGRGSPGGADAASRAHRGGSVPTRRLQFEPRSPSGQAAAARAARFSGAHVLSPGAAGAGARGCGSPVEAATPASREEAALEPRGAEAAEPRTLPASPAGQSRG